ncbi:long-chain-acyl-CoA synthetase [Gordonia jinhuaensis]|nr:long-chain-acyl-CoA synthetase [Gordonia jinhuaensis]
MRPDATVMLGNAAGLLLRRPSATDSIGKIFQKHAAAHPDRPALRFEGKSYSYGEVNRAVNRHAALLQREGVGVGDVVAILSTNRPEAVLAMLAAVKIGAVAGMLNYNQRHQVLEHSLGVLDAKVMIADPTVADALETVSAQAIPSKVYTFDELDAASARCTEDNPAVTATLPAKTKAFYIFTSGTTGMPKASIMSHYRWMMSMSGIGGMGVRLHHNDTMYVPLPLYHNNALTVALSSVLASGACLAIGKKFSASRFWDDVILNRATAFCYIGELCRYLLAQPPKPTDRTHSVRLVVGNGMRPDMWDEFTHRFGVKRIVEFYGASELNLAFINVFSVDRTAGFTPYKYKVVAYTEDGEPKRDAQGRLTPVGRGKTGLLISEISDKVPFDGYTDADASERKIIRDAFADGDAWFNSGDLVRDQGHHHIAFVDRLGDTFRWKGENVATTEIESALDASDQVQQSVVFGVEIPGTDGKAGMAAVTVRDDGGFDPSTLAEELYESLPGYAVPLFIRVVDELEQTSTFKTRKVELREQGYTKTGDDPLYVLSGRRDGYVEFYEGYVEDVANARAPRG